MANGISPAHFNQQPNFVQNNNSMMQIKSMNSEQQSYP